jgi:hypothetical protein
LAASLRAGGVKSRNGESRKQKSQGGGCGGQRQFLAPDALHLGHPGVGIEFGHGEEFVAGLFDSVFHPQPRVILAGFVLLLR